MNEKMAILLGWKRHEFEWPNGTPDTFWADPVASQPEGMHGAPPDFTTWERFPEMQAYVRGLSTRERGPIAQRLMGALEVGPNDATIYGLLLGSTNITPTLLRDSILAAVGEGVTG